MKLLNVFLNALYPEGAACLLCNRNARLDRRGLCEKCRESIDCLLYTSPSPRD